MPDLEDQPRSEHEDRISSALRGLYSEAPVALPLPYDTVRRRGMGRRNWRRAAVGAVAAAVCAVGLLSSGAVWPGRQQGAAAPAAAGPTSAPPTGTIASPPSREVAVYVDLAAHTVRVQSGTTTLRTLPATAGRPDTPTPTGTMKVVDKQASLRLSTSTGPTPRPSDGGEYELTLPWCVRLIAGDGRSTDVCGMNWYGPSILGRENRTSGAVGLNTEDARWFFDQVQVGDPVSVVNPDRSAPGDTGPG
ncbi:L,D-transpeptidase [Kitasatospora sp. NPDC058170]|uniref:L,D-transpeptidase n=1 Tax=Kitasatospora sp. NPDC058170 TaxID=3346364 RepID=UPI0036DE3C01